MYTVPPPLPPPPTYSVGLSEFPVLVDELLLLCPIGRALAELVHEALALLTMLLL